MRKKLLIGFLCLMMMFGTTVQVFAEDKSYEVKEAEMTIDISDEFIVFGRIVDEFDENLELIGSSKKELENVFKKGNIYLNAVMIPPEYEIVLTLAEYEGSQDIFDFNLFSESELDTLGKQLSSGSTEESGITYTGYETYKQNQAQFIVFDLYQESASGKVYGKQYYTIINGQAINITMHSYTGELPAEKLEVLKNTVDSINFKEVREKPRDGVMSNPMLNASVKMILIVVALVLFGGITLIILAVKRKHGRDYEDNDYDEEAMDKIEEDDYDEEAMDEIEKDENNFSL